MRIGNITICDYSDKSIAVQGETKPYKDIIKELHGSYNPYLRGGRGWVISKKWKAILITRLTKAQEENK